MQIFKFTPLGFLRRSFKYSTDVWEQSVEKIWQREQSSECFILCHLWCGCFVGTLRCSCKILRSPIFSTIMGGFYCDFTSHTLWMHTGRTFCMMVSNSAIRHSPRQLISVTCVALRRNYIRQVKILFGYFFGSEYNQQRLHVGQEWHFY